MAVRRKRRQNKIKWQENFFLISTCPVQAGVTEGGAQSAAGGATEDGGRRGERQRLHGEPGRQRLGEAAPLLPGYDPVRPQPGGVSPGEGQGPRQM